MTQSKSTYFTYPTVHGPITICANARGITNVSFERQSFEGVNQASAVTNKAATQIQEYLAGKRRAFDVPLDPAGSAFQKEVWAEVSALAYGTTCTAADVAESLGKSGSHRSIGTAIRRNPLPILIPTHRVDLPNATGKTARIFRALRAMEQKANS